MFAERIEGDDVGGVRMGGSEYDGRCRTGFVGFLPTLRAHAPPVARTQTAEPIRGACRAQVVARLSLLGEELAGDDHAHGVVAEILRSCVAAAVSVEAGQRLGAADFQLAAEYVAIGCHDINLTNRTVGARRYVALRPVWHVSALSAPPLAGGSSTTWSCDVIKACPVCTGFVPLLFGYQDGEGGGFQLGDRAGQQGRQLL